MQSNSNKEETVVEFILRVANEASTRHSEYGDERLRLEGAFNAYRNVLAKIQSSERPNEPTDSPTPVAE